MDLLAPATVYPPFTTLFRLALALFLGLFVGLERERQHKEAGVRTFAFCGLIGGLGGLQGDGYGLAALLFVGLLVAFLNWQTLRADLGLELTTSAAMLVVTFNGILCGEGHTFTPVAVAVGTAALLTWKDRLAGFSINLTDAELRSAILLGVLAFVVYPVLPDHPVDPWGLIDPHTAWLTIILIAAIGFANYVLLKGYGRRGVELAGFLGGLVNSTVTVSELAERVRETGGRLATVAYRGVLLATAAMIVRNAVLLGVLTIPALLVAAAPLALMLVASLVLTVMRRSRDGRESGSSPLRLDSPFSLVSTFKFGLVFLALQVAGSLAQAALGETGFYAVSLMGGLVSSASAVASAGTLAARGVLPPAVAGTGAVVASLASVLINVPLVARSQDRRLTQQLALSLGLVVILGLAGTATLVAAPHLEPALKSAVQSAVWMKGRS